MKASSGRLSQYLLLSSTESLSKYLVETELFSEASLYEFIKKYKTLVIKPVFGPGEVCVFTEKTKFRVVSKKNALTCTNKEEVYRHLIRHEIKQKFYVIKPIKMNCRYSQGNYQYFVTVHRKSALHEWCVQTYAEQASSKNGRGIYKYFRHEIRNVSMVVAKKLGESFPECNTIVIEIVYDMKNGIWIQDTVLHLSKSKWNQYLTLITKRSLASYVPDTDLFTESTFNHFLHRYKAVIIKPCDGQEGSGIVQISSNNGHSYEIHSGLRKITKATLEETYHFIEESYLSEKYYIIQQRLPLATVDACPIDCRVIVQKMDSTWTSTGKIVKVAGEGFFITNAAQELLSLENAIQNSNMSWVDIDVLEEEIEEICIIAARRLEKNKLGIKIIGFDIGITYRGDIWIIEGNDNPDLSMFYKLEDKTIYANILKAKRN
ncbi:YheC/YheD family protein [Sporosarcina sp. NPDC096371]|uniref:YheC/YheD family protein n=1 Tax=Sporosarcina sp. NPDC096371 TaxID=3364530 RepID=UPI0038005B1B